MEHEGSLFHTNAHQPSLSWASSIQSIPPYPNSCGSFFILPFHLCLGLLSGIFPSGFPSKMLYTPLLPPIRATCPAHLVLLDFITWKILGAIYRSLSSLLHNFLHSRYLVPLRPKYSPQHSIFKHPQPTFLPQYEWPSFTPIHNNRQNYSSVYLNL